MTNTFELGEKTADDRPNSELDIYHHLLKSQASDDYLSRINVGTGNYSNAEMWQQIQSYRDGLIGEAALSRRLVERAVAEATHAVALQGYRWWDNNDETYKVVEGWVDLDESERCRLDRRRWLGANARKKWEALPKDEKLEAVAEFAGLDGTWIPPHWRMLEMRHEASRSRGARLLDNITGRIQEIFSNDHEQATDALTNGHNGGGSR